MFKKFMLALTLALSLAAFSASAFAQVSPAQIPAETLEAFKNEAPLAQKDIDSYINVMGAMSSVQGDPAKALEIYKNEGWTEARAAYVFTKVTLGQVMGAGATPEQLGMGEVPEVMMPTKAEIDLVTKNSGALQKASMDAAAAMQKQ